MILTFFEKLEMARVEMSVKCTVLLTQDLKKTILRLTGAVFSAFGFIVCKKCKYEPTNIYNTIYTIEGCIRGKFLEDRKPASLELLSSPPKKITLHVKLLRHIGLNA